jgi:hypothetical protein
LRSDSKKANSEGDTVSGTDDGREKPQSVLRRKLDPACDKKTLVWSSGMSTWPIF